MNHIKYIKKQGFKKTRKTVICKLSYHDKLNSILSSYIKVGKESHKEFFNGELHDINETLIEVSSIMINSLNSQSKYWLPKDGRWNQFKFDLDNNEFIYVYFTKQVLKVVLTNDDLSLFNVSSLNMDIFNKTNFNKVLKDCIKEERFREYQIKKLLQKTNNLNYG